MNRSESVSEVVTVQWNSCLRRSVTAHRLLFVPLKRSAWTFSSAVFNTQFFKFFTNRRRWVTRHQLFAGRLFVPLPFDLSETFHSQINSADLWRSETLRGKLTTTHRSSYYTCNQYTVPLTSPSHSSRQLTSPKAFFLHVRPPEMFLHHEKCSACEKNRSLFCKSEPLTCCSVVLFPAPPAVLVPNIILQNSHSVFMTTNKVVLMDIISESWVSTRLLVESSLNHLQVKTLKLVKTNIWKQEMREPILHELN